MTSAVSASAYEAARRRAAFVNRSDRGRIVVSGEDRRSYLQGLLTNDVAALTAGQGCYAAYLTAQGRMIADLHVYELGDVVLLTTAGDVKDTVMARLDQFIFGEDVQLGDVTSSFAQIAVVGPAASHAVASVIDGADAAALAALPEHGNRRAQFAGSPAIVARVSDTGEPGFDLFVESRRAGALEAALAAAEVPPLDASTADAIRIESGVAAFHRDMDEDTIPLEAGIESRAISFTKGCYVGQEVIIRVMHRGHGRVARKLVGIVFEGSQVPVPGVPVHAGEREIGRVTSSALSPSLRKPIALGYLHRDFVEPGTAVAVGGVGGTVAALPFVRATD
jgi:folate-binding protein YgfZ